MAMVRLFITIFLCLILLTHAGESTINADEGHSETIVAETPVQHVDHPQHGSLGEEPDVSLDRCPNYNEDSENTRALGGCTDKVEIKQHPKPKVLTTVEADDVYNDLVKDGEVQKMWEAFRDSPEFQRDYGSRITDKWLNDEKNRFYKNFNTFLKNVAVFTNEQTVIHSAGSLAHQCSIDAFKITGTIGGACGGLAGGTLGLIFTLAGGGRGDVVTPLAYFGYAVCGGVTGVVGYILTWPFAFNYYYFSKSGVGINNELENNMKPFKDRFVDHYVKDDNLDDQCSICQESFHAEGYKNAKGFVMLPCCQKLAHEKCIQELIKRNKAKIVADKKCFQCRQTVTWTVKVSHEFGNPFKN